jgi:hypothetical protein
LIVVDEYLAVRALGGDWPAGLPDDDLALTSTRHWRLLLKVHAPGDGQLSQLLAALPGGDRTVIRFPHPEILSVLDPRPLLDSAASIAARFGTTGFLIAESLAAGLAHGRQLWFGNPHNVGRILAEAAEELGIAVHLAPQSA